VVCTYVILVLMMLALENWLLYPRSSAADWVAPPDRRIRDVELVAADGTGIHAWWLPVEGATGAVLYCHGNAGNLSYRGHAVVQWAREMGESVLIFDYPGYGRSGGSPSEAGCYAAADAAYDWLTNQSIPAERVLLFGKSLGGAVATDLASRRPHRALVLAKTFPSAPAVAQRIYPWLPAQLLMRNRFDSLAKIGKCGRPVFMAHGDCDGLIPCDLGERLFAAANEPKRFVHLVGADHNSPFESGFFSALRNFLKDVEAPVTSN
jgi:fermentation-respiration switch protein FrsA (DUF1100 family)